jgi:LysM repeat protein
MSSDAPNRLTQKRVTLIKGLILTSFTVLILTNVDLFFKKKNVEHIEQPTQEIASNDISPLATISTEPTQNIDVDAYLKQIDELKNQIEELSKVNEEEKKISLEQLSLLQNALNETKDASDDNASYQRLYFAKLNELEKHILESEKTRTDLSNQVDQLSRQLADQRKNNAKLSDILTTQTQNINPQPQQQDKDDWRQKYLEEHRIVTEKEELIAQFSQTLNEQKNALNKIEQARQKLVQELNEVNNANAQTKIVSTTSPTPKVETSDKKVHKVAKGETLSGISLKYYGTPSRWSEIYEANKAQIQDKNSIRPGTEIVIP